MGTSGEASIFGAGNVMPMAGLGHSGGCLTEELLRAQLAKILGSAAFRRSERISRFLKYVVEHSILGNRDQIREYSLGVDVFDKGESFDPRLESLVRVEARRLRQMLRNYYELEGQHDPILIEIPSGCYAPEFRPGIHRRAQTALSGAKQSGHGAGLPTIAVLPLADLSSGRSEESFCDGLAEQLIDALNDLGVCRVVARTSTLAFKQKSEDIREIARRLGANWIVEGSARRRQDEGIRVSVRLVEAEGGYHTWSKVFLTGTGDAACLEDEICRTTLEAVSAQLSRPLPTAPTGYSILDGRGQAE